MIEIIIALIIVAILSTLALTNYGSYKERTMDKEAKANLKLIIAAEKIYKLEIGAYYGTTQIALINENLRLLLPTDEKNWKYITTVSAGNACAEATRATDATKRWKMSNTEDEPGSGACP